MTAGRLASSGSARNACTSASVAPSRKTLSPLMAADRFSREMNSKSADRVTSLLKAGGRLATLIPSTLNKRACGLEACPME
ncbi:hypothetical protein D3C77_745610 [compost metagenome]